MDEKLIYKQLDFYRYLTLKLLDSIDEETADVVPSGFNNSIRWNLGHIYVSHENIALRIAGEETLFPDGYIELFKGGSKPSDWNTTPPSLAELRQYLSEQPERIKNSLEGKMHLPVAQPFAIPGVVEFNTIGETLNFALYHEGQHTGFIKALIKAVKAKG